MREDERTKTKQEKTKVGEIEDDEFQLLTALSQGMSTECLTLLPFIFAYIFHSFLVFPSFPLRFLSVSFPLYLFFSSFYSMLLYSILLSIYFSMFVSHDLSVVLFYYCLPLFFLSLSLFIFSFICILYYLKRQNFTKKLCLHPNKNHF